jgi:hypothetical protein
VVLQDRRAGDTKATVYRHLEIHSHGLVDHRLFRGTNRRIGEEVDLEQHGETENLEPFWRHGEDMLMGRVVNRRGRDITLGVSEYHGIKDFLLDLNEALTIGAENARLTAKKRIVAPASSVTAPDRIDTRGMIDRGDGTFIQPANQAAFDAGEDVFVIDPLDEQLGKGDSSSPFRVLEYSFDAQALITHKRDLVEGALTRVGITPQWVGLNTGQTDGYAITGTALRFRLIPTTKAGHGKARPWDTTLPRVLALAAAIDALGEDDGGFGRDWADLDTLPTVERANPLPVDEVEEAQVDQTLITAGVASRRSRVKKRHPDWTDEQLNEELTAIQDDHPAPSIGV